jgi:hypothetical protein
MHILILILSLVLTVSSYAEIFSKKKLQKKIQHQPSWMLEQIAHDLSPFSASDLTEEKMTQTMQAVQSVPSSGLSQLLCISIKNNQLSWWSLTEKAGDDRLIQFINFVQEAMRIQSFPDVKFVLSLWDCFDRPLYVHPAKCPIFCVNKQRYNRKVILVPETRTYLYYGTDVWEVIKRKVREVPWQRKKEIAFWRGNTTGGHYDYHEWDFKPRSELVLFSKYYPNLVDAKFVGDYCLEPVMKSIFQQYGLFGSHVYQADQLEYKYLLAVDGNACSSSFKWQLFSGSAVLKQDSDFIEFYYNALKPYVHYIPYRADCYDLEERIQWLKSHDNETRQIADNARAFAEENLSLEDMAAYYYHLLEAYSKLQSL